MSDVAQKTTVQFHVQDLSGTQHTIEGEAGTSLMEIIRGAGIDDIPAYCGGVCSCASCHVHISAEYLGLLPAMSPDEDDLLDGADARAEGSRLSCQIPAAEAMNGMKLVIVASE